MDIGTYLKHFSYDPRISCKQRSSRSVLPPQALFFVRYVGTSVLLKLKTRFLISVPISAGMHILFHWFLNLGKLYVRLAFFTRWDPWIHWKPFFLGPEFSFVFTFSFWVFAFFFSSFRLVYHAEDEKFWILTLSLLQKFQTFLVLTNLYHNFLQTTIHPFHQT